MDWGIFMGYMVIEISATATRGTLAIQVGSKDGVWLIERDV
jgi:hypothetical protein